MDLKSAFDKIDREILWEMLEGRGIRRGILERIKEIYENNKNVVKVNGKVSECFWTEKGVRQGCPLSPILFSANSRYRRRNEKRIIRGSTSRWRKILVTGLRG